VSLILDGTNGLSDVDGSASTPAIRGTDTNTGIFFPAADTIAFAEGGAEVARFDSSGNLAVGTTSIVANNRLTVDGGRLVVSNGPVGAGQASSAKGVQTYFDATNNIGYIYSTQSGVANYRLSLNGNDVDFNQGAMILYSDGYLGVPQAYAGTTGSAANVHILSSGVFIRSTSSLKYKKDIQDATHGLAEVLQLRSVTYKGKSESDGETVFGGLIAEEVHEAGLTEFVQYADDGTPDALSYGNMVALAFKAIQEQQAIITDLKSRIEALEAK
jgi:hypothetical protein